jgi:DNA invertase Pin-like site-specific DNA recombinase
VAQAVFVLGSSREASRLLQVLRERGISLVCLDIDEDISLDRERRLVVSKGGAVLVQKILAALSICDSTRHGEAIRATKRSQKREGKYLGGPVPFGWQIGDDGYLVQNVEQQRMIREMLRLREDRWSYRDIASKLLEKHGLNLSHEGIRKVLETNMRKKDEEKRRISSVQGKANALLQKHSPGAQGTAGDHGSEKKES